MTNIIHIFVIMVEKAGKSVKRVVVIYWKNKPGHTIEVFSNLKNFCLHHKKYSYHTMNNYLSKARVAYENNDVRVERQTVITKPLLVGDAVWKRAIVPVVRKVALKDANDEERDLQYWLAKTPVERMLAVKMLREQFYGKNIRMDKTKVAKRKLK